MENEKLFELMSKMYNEIQDISSDLKDVKQKVETIDTRTTKIEMCIENNVLEKVSALFDARSLQQDTNNTIVQSLERIENEINTIEKVTARNCFDISHLKAIK